MRVLVIIILLFITGIQYRRYRDILCPAVMMNIMWILSVCFSTMLAPNFNMKFETGILLILGALFFQIGFRISSSGSYHNQTLYIVRPKVLKLSVFILIPFFFISMKSLYDNMIENALYEALRGEDAETITVGGYFAKFIQYISILFIILYNRPENKFQKKRLKPYVFIICAMGFITAIMNATRNGMLFYFLPFIAALMLSNNFSNKKQLQYLGISVIAFLLYYAYISFNKYSWAYESSNSEDVLSSEIITYLSGSIIAFDNAIESHSFTRMGSNVFRFFIAISDSMFGTSRAIRLANEFETAYGVSTNVFTFYDFYLRDFGIVFAIFMQFVISCVHGISYKCRHTVSGLFFYSMLSYPLIMQFFQDQYISLLSTWVQVIIVFFIVLKTNIFTLCYEKRQ